MAKQGKALEDPFEHSRAAQKYESAGDQYRAEESFQKAIKHADALPLDEYRENLATVMKELSKGRSSKLLEDALDVEVVTNAYHELIAMPFLTRVQLAGFYARVGKCDLARATCRQAFERGLEAETLRCPTVAIMERRAHQLAAALEDMIGPQESERIFHELFHRLDINRDGYVDEDELKKALLDIDIDEEGHSLIRFLLHNYETVMQSSKDQLWFADYLGISKSDLASYQRRRDHQLRKFSP
ncbi:MAG: hypothetical protein K2X93_02535 [Candidatus Obscuribacterales bacterium]|nr:hypothetical protein [Candidatus Obscuribacterales bacterium]